MFSFSCYRVLKNCSLKHLHNEYITVNKYLHSVCRKSDYCGQSVVKVNVNPNLSSVRKIRVGSSCEKKFSIRCFSSKLVNNLNEQLKVENVETEKVTTEEESSATDDESLDFYKVDEEAITNGDPDLLKILRLCMLEVETYRQEGYDVPSSLKTAEWKELVLCKSRSAKLKYLRYLFLNECRRKNDKIRKEKKRIERREEFAKIIEQSNPDHIRYGIGGSTFLLRVQDHTMNALANNRLIIAMKFGQNLVIDCAYDQYMTNKENKYCAKQLMYVFAINRQHDDPFNIHFTGVNRESLLMKQLKIFIPTMDDCNFPMNVTEKSYLELFPKERLVYLTPHCRNDLKTFNHDDIYIIGGLVDKMNCEHLSLAKAKAEGLRMARFPLDRYLSWAMGTKSLTIDQCMKIMLDLKTSGSWEKALKHVPSRKVLNEVNKSQLTEDDEEARDKSMQFGQSYVTSHEWGLSKKQRDLKSRIYKNDLRTIVARFKKTGSKR